MTPKLLMLPLAFAVCLAAAPTQAAPDDAAGQSRASRAEISSASQGKSTRRVTRRTSRTQVRRVQPAPRVGFETVRFPNCLFVFCQGQPLLIGVAF